MIKPDWKNAPGWAQWWAQDYSGRAYWWELEPEADDGTFNTWYVDDSRCVSDDSRKVCKSPYDRPVYWRESLQQRPAA